MTIQHITFTKKDHHKLFSWFSTTKSPMIIAMIATMIHEQNTIFHHEKTELEQLVTCFVGHAVKIDGF